MTKLKSITLVKSVFVFIATFLPLFIGIYVCIPFLLSYRVPFLVCYLVAFQITPFLLIALFFVCLYRKEGNPFAWKVFIERLRLRVTVKNMLFGVLLAIFGIVTYVLLQPITLIIARTSLFAPPSWFAPDLNPLLRGQPGTFMGMSLHGQVFIPILYVIGWFFNILSEELLFRGYLLPRMELRLGNKAWMVNGFCWWIWHCFWRWQLISLMPFVFALPFVAQKTKSTIPGIIGHGCMNLIAIVIIIINVIK
jgi:membrane protease YdiL (CAAX protease family)